MKTQGESCPPWREKRLVEWFARQCSRLGQCSGMPPSAHKLRLRCASGCYEPAFDEGRPEPLRLACRNWLRWTDEVMDKAEELLPTLIAAGYAARDDEANTWWSTKKGVARANEIVIEGPH
jgi:hypothetical protein